MSFEPTSETLSRRTFLRNATLGAAGLSLFANAPTPALAEDKSPYAPFRMGIQSYSLRGFRVQDALARTKALGLKYWEAYPVHFNVTEAPKVIAEYKALLRAYDVKLVAYGVVDFTNNEVEARHVFEFAKLMGIENITAYPYPDAFPLLDRLTAEYRINVGIHNHGPGDNLYDLMDKGLKAIEGHNVRIGSCNDTGHYLRSDEDPVEAARKFGKRTYGVHLKDVAVGPNGEKQFTEIGKGKLDTVALLKVLKENRYKGLLSLEYEEHEQDPMPYIEECLAATRLAIAKANAKPA